MDERRDTAIKLFGKILIPLQGSVDDSIGAGEEENKLQRFEKTASKIENSTNFDAKEAEDDETENKKQRKPNTNFDAKEAEDDETENKKQRKPNTNSDAKEAEEDETENEKQKKPKNGDDDQEEAAVPKKPDKIEPCPRCDSSDTKFCYFNNYNVNQPRHFCKDCQRYWTAGGSLRNVPVGAGRRKTKSSACYRRANLNPTHPTTTTTTTSLSFGSDSPLCESMASVLNLTGARNVFESCEENSSQSSMTGLSSTTDDGAGTASAAHREVAAAQIPCVNGSTWAYPISPASAAFAFPLYPAVAYWGCTVPSIHPPHNNSATLGKHSREGDKLYDDDTNSEKASEGKHFWMPKTLRISDPDEAAKSSIWATVGFKNKKSSAVRGGDGLFEPFQSRDDGMKSASEMPQVLRANPAAFARSMNYRESS